MKIVQLSTIMVILTILVFCCLSNAKPIDTIFTYEGYFLDNNDPAEGIYDLELILYDTLTR